MSIETLASEKRATSTSIAEPFLSDEPDPRAHETGSEHPFSNLSGSSLRPGTAQLDSPDRGSAGSKPSDSENRRLDSAWSSIGAERSSLILIGLSFVLGMVVTSSMSGCESQVDESSSASPTHQAAHRLF